MRPRKKLPMLTLYAFPTMIFVDRKGQVRKIHTGYSGPATGEHYTQFVAEFKATLDQLLAGNLENMPSFDIVSEIDTHELTNAVDQAVRELSPALRLQGHGCHVRARGHDGDHERTGGFPTKTNARIFSS